MKKNRKKEKVGIQSRVQSFTDVETRDLQNLFAVSI